MSNLIFEKIIPDPVQIRELYELICMRKHKISHKKTPSMEEHETFVLNHPYRDWFLVKLGGELIGSFYISHENTVGLNLETNQEKNIVSHVLLFVKENYSPLDPIPSVRNGSFSINVSPENKFLIEALESCNARLAQVSYYLP